MSLIILSTLNLDKYQDLVNVSIIEAELRVVREYILSFIEKLCCLYNIRIIFLFIIGIEFPFSSDIILSRDYKLK